jgi:hypothetical protein
VQLHGRVHESELNSTSAYNTSVNMSGIHTFFKKCVAVLHTLLVLMFMYVNRKDAGGFPKGILQYQPWEKISRTSDEEMEKKSKTVTGLEA